MENNRTVGKNLLMALFIIIVVVLISAGLYYWYNFANKVPEVQPVVAVKTTEEEIKQQGAALTYASKIDFPNISKLTPIDFKNLSDEDKIFIYEGVSAIGVNSISYDNSQKGFFLSYVVPNVKIIDFLQSKINFDSTYKIYLSKWKSLGSNSMELVAISDMENSSTGAKAQIRYTQKGNDVEVIVKTIK